MREWKFVEEYGRGEGRDGGGRGRYEGEGMKGKGRDAKTRVNVTEPKGTNFGNLIEASPKLMVRCPLTPP